MALISTINCKHYHEPFHFYNPVSKPNPSQFSGRGKSDVVLGSLIVQARIRVRPVHKLSTTCSEYSMIAYKKYGVAKWTLLTAWRLCRCNPLGGSGFDPPRWFDETTPPEQ